MLMGFIVSLFVGVVVGRLMIPMLHKLKFGQEIREEGPQSHLKKQGTPTMGGILFFIAVLAGLLASGTYTSRIGFLVLCAVLFGLIGLWDDALKILFRHSEGLTPKQKIFLQFLASLIILALGIFVIDIPSSFSIPLTGIVLDNSVVYTLIMLIIIIGTTNSCNLTDGIDGLLSSVTVVVMGCYLAMAILLGQKDVAIFALVMMAACMAFLVYNWHPAKVFMGDTGSFFIGGAVVGLAMVTKTELLIPLVGIIYLAESVSDIIQVVVFKKTGRRVFKMAPLHHHFELNGLRETRVVGLFTSVTIVGSLLALLIFYLSPSFVL